MEPEEYHHFFEKVMHEENKKLKCREMELQNDREDVKYALYDHEKKRQETRASINR